MVGDSGAAHKRAAPSAVTTKAPAPEVKNAPATWINKEWEGLGTWAKRIMSESAMRADSAFVPY